MTQILLSPGMLRNGVTLSLFNLLKLEYSSLICGKLDIHVINTVQPKRNARAI